MVVWFKVVGYRFFAPNVALCHQTTKFFAKILLGKWQNDFVRSVKSLLLSFKSLVLRGSLGDLGMALLFLEIVVKEVVGKNQLARERVARGIVAHCKYVLLMYFVISPLISLSYCSNN